MNKLLNLLLLTRHGVVEPSAAGAASATLETAQTQYIEAGGTRFAYRIVGAGRGVPLVLLQHFTGTMDYWDPAVVNGLASSRKVVVFDNTGVGASSGTVPDNVEQMADDAWAFIQALGLGKVDLLGYSLGGMVAQSLAARQPEQIRKVVLANTAHQGGGNDLMKVLADARSQTTYADPRMVLFFTNSPQSIEAGKAFIQRTSARQNDRAPESAPEVAGAQAKAIIVFSTTQDSSNALLKAIAQPVLIVTGSNDTMLPSESSYAMFKILANAQLVMFPDSSHGAIFEYHHAFVTLADEFLHR